MYFANALGKFRVIYDSAYNWGRRSLPMAWFCKGRRGNIKIYAYPKGWRGWQVLGSRPLKWIPYSAEDSVSFVVEVEFKIPVNSQIDMQIYKEGGANPKAVGSVDKGRTKTVINVDAYDQHDNGNLLYSLHINSGGAYRVVRSAPIPDNYLIFLTLGVLIGLLIKTLWDLLI